MDRAASGSPGSAGSRSTTGPSASWASPSSVSQSLTSVAAGVGPALGKVTVKAKGSLRAAVYREFRPMRLASRQSSPGTPTKSHTSRSRE